MAVQQFPPPVARGIVQKKIAAFTGDGTWTVPAGVTYAIAHMIGGGGGVGRGSSGVGSTSSVAFASGTVEALGGRGQDVNVGAVTRVNTVAGQANSGRSGSYDGKETASSSGHQAGNAGDARWIVAAAAVTPAASITVTVGAGGAAGTGGAVGGSGYVYIEYYEEV